MKQFNIKWLHFLLVSLGILIIGFGQSYPVDRPASEISPLMSTSILYWIGLVLSFWCLTGWVLSTNSNFIHFLASILFVLLFTSPQMLYLAWGADAGSLVDIAGYTRDFNNFDLARDVAVNSYFQWPLSLFFQRFLEDLTGSNSYFVLKLGFFFECLVVASCLYLLFSRKETANSGAAFWGIVVYFIGFYYIMNWQATPYSFGLTLMLAGYLVLERKESKYKFLFIIFLIVGLESHALFGFWLILYLIIYWLSSLFSKGSEKRIFESTIFLVLVAQITIIFYKNTRFFHYLVRTFQGFYDQLLILFSGDRAIVRQASMAFTNVPEDWLGKAIKFLGYLDLTFVVIAITLAGAYIMLKKLVGLREASFLITGGIHFAIGIFFAAIGTRSFQLIAFSIAYFVVQAVSKKERIGSIVLGFCVASLILFPPVLMRTHQINENYVINSDLYLKDFFDQVINDLEGDTTIFTEGIRPIQLIINAQKTNLYYIQIKEDCSGNYLIVDSLSFQQKLAQMNRFSQNLYHFDQDFKKVEFAGSKIYDNNQLWLIYGDNCGQMLKFLKQQ